MTRCEIRNRWADVTGILPNKGGSVGRRDHDLPYVKWNICIYIRHLHMMLAFQMFTQIMYLSINVRIHPDVHVRIIYSALEVWMRRTV